MCSCVRVTRLQRLLILYSSRALVAKIALAKMSRFLFFLVFSSSVGVSHRRKYTQLTTSNCSKVFVIGGRDDLHHQSTPRVE